MDVSHYSVFIYNYSLENPLYPTVLKQSRRGHPVYHKLLVDMLKRMQMHCYIKYFLYMYMTGWNVHKDWLMSC